MWFSAVVLFAGNQSCKATSHIKKNWILLGCFYQHRNNTSKLFVMSKIDWLISNSKNPKKPKTKTKQKNPKQTTSTKKKIKNCVWRHKKETAARSAVIKVLEICFKNQQFQMAQPHLFTDTWKIAYSFRGHLKMYFALWGIF